MRSSRVLGVVLGVVLSMGTWSPVAAAATGTVSGRVTDAAGAPLAGVDVEVQSRWGPTSTTVVTAADGTYAATGLPDDTYQVCFWAAGATGGSSPTGYVDQCWRDVSTTYGWSDDQLTFVTIAGGSHAADVSQSLPSAGAVSGVVTDADGTPLAGATVLASTGPYDDRMPRATTDTLGRFSIDTLAPHDEYTVCVSAEGVDGGSSATGYLDQCYGGGRAQGHPWSLRPWDPPQRFAVAGAEVTQLSPIRLAGAGQISGRLTERDGDPIAGVRVYGWGDGRMSITAVDTTGANGRFVLSVDNEGGSANSLYHGTRLPLDPFTLLYSPAPGTDFVEAYHGGVYSPGNEGWGQVEDVVPLAGTPTILDETLDRASSVAGIVTDKDGTPLANADVVLRHGEMYIDEVATTSNGRYRFDGLPAARYSVCVEAERVRGGVSPAGYLNACSGGTKPRDPQRVRLDYDEDVAGVDVVLPSAGGISGRVLDEDGAPMSYATVTVDRDGRRVANQWTESDGSWKVTGLASGTYEVCFDPGGVGEEQPECWADVDVRDTPHPVRVRAGSVTTGVDAVLSQAGPSPDEVAPRTRMPALPRVSPRRVLTVRYSAIDGETGVADHDVRYRQVAWDEQQFSEHTTPVSWSNRTATRVELEVEPGTTYCFSARSRDVAGNVSPWTGERCTSVPLDDRALTRSRGWSRATTSDAFEGTISRTDVRGATMKLAGAQGHGLGVLVQKCRRCGTVAVVVDGRVVDRISTRSARTRSVLVVLGDLDLSGSTVGLRAARGGRVVVDGLAVLL